MMMTITKVPMVTLRQKQNTSTFTKKFKKMYGESVDTRN